MRMRHNNRTNTVRYHASKSTGTSVQNNTPKRLPPRKFRTLQALLVGFDQEFTERVMAKIRLAADKEAAGDDDAIARLVREDEDVQKLKEKLGRCR